MWLYRLIKIIVKFLFWIFVDFEVEGTENVPPKGPALLVCNHVNLMDPIVPGVALKRRVSFMAKEEIFAKAFPRWLLRTLEIVPVRRGKIGSRRALQRAEEMLRRGWVFCMYPEGTRSRQPGMGPAHDGAALLAMRTGVPVVPVAITGTHQVMREGHFFPSRGSITIRFGEPIHVPQTAGRINRQEMEHLTERIMRRIAAMLPPEYHGVYAGEAALAETGR